MNYQEQYPRVNIHEEARMLKEKGYIWAEIDPLQGTFTYQSSEAIDVWKKQKPEFYKVSGVILDRGVNRMVQAIPKNKPYGLISFPEYHPVTALHDFDMIGFDMSVTFNRYMKLELENLQELSKTSSTDPIQSTYKRFQEYFLFMQKYLNKEAREDLFFAGGINTATDIMLHTLHAIPYVILAEAKRGNGLLPSRSQTPEGWIEVAKNSYPFIAELAMYHLYLAEGISTNIKGNTLFFQKKNLQLKKYKNSYRLDMLPEMREVTEEKMTRIITKKEEENKFAGDVTVGCIAMINFGEGSAVDRIWSWNIDLAPVIYQSPQFLETYNYVVNSS